MGPIPLLQHLLPKQRAGKRDAKAAYAELPPEQVEDKLSELEGEGAAPLEQWAGRLDAEQAKAKPAAVIDKETTTASREEIVSELDAMLRASKLSAQDYEAKLATITDGVARRS